MRTKTQRPSVFLKHLVEVSRPFVSKARLVPSGLDFAYRATLKTVVCTVGIVLLVATAKAIVGDHIVIEPISVPRKLEENGYSGAVVSRRLLAHVQDIARGGGTLHLGSIEERARERVNFRGEEEF